MNLASDKNNQRAKPCAVYTRYSSDLQRPTSIEDQIRNCRDFADRGKEPCIILQGWILDDREVSGRTLLHREGLQRLIAASKSENCPFQCILIHDTSRLGRNVGDVMKTADIFKHNGVELQFVNPPLSSKDPSFRPMLTLKAMMDEEHSLATARRVHRGQKGRILARLIHGGRYYGYRNEDVLDLTGGLDHGRQAVVGVKLVVIPEQAAIINRIYEMYCAGLGYSKITDVLNSEGIKPPTPTRRTKFQMWSWDSVWMILRNKKYIGISEWNRTQSSLDPETGREIARLRPIDEWVRVEVPEWRIISDDLWNKVQDEIARRQRHGRHQEAGRHRTKSRKPYLLSGFLYCGVCGSTIGITTGSGLDVRYGCSNHRYRGRHACANSLTIRRDSAENQVLNWLSGDGASEVIERAVALAKDEFRIKAATDANARVQMEEEHSRLKLQSKNAAAAIAASGHEFCGSLLEHLRELETRILTIEQQLLTIDATGHNLDTPKIEDIRQWISKHASIDEALKDSERGRIILSRFLARIILAPREIEGASVFEAQLEFRFPISKASVEHPESLNGQQTFYVFSVAGPTLEILRGKPKPQHDQLAKRSTGKKVLSRSSRRRPDTPAFPPIDGVSSINSIDTTRTHKCQEERLDR